MGSFRASLALSAERSTATTYARSRAAVLQKSSTQLDLRCTRRETTATRPTLLCAASSLCGSSTDSPRIPRQTHRACAQKSATSSRLLQTGLEIALWTLAESLCRLRATQIHDASLQCPASLHEDQSPRLILLVVTPLTCCLIACQISTVLALLLGLLRGFLSVHRMSRKTARDSGNKRHMIGRSATPRLGPWRSRIVPQARRFIGPRMPEHVDGAVGACCNRCGGQNPRRHVFVCFQA